MRNDYGNCQENPDTCRYTLESLTYNFDRLVSGNLKTL